MQLFTKIIVQQSNRFHFKFGIFFIVSLDRNGRSIISCNFFFPIFTPLFPWLWIFRAQTLSLKRGPTGKCLIKSDIISHLNFKAKNKDDPDAPVESFFAEVVNGRNHAFALFCVRLDPSNSIYHLVCVLNNS